MQSDPNIAISIQYAIDDLNYLMPQFVTQLEVPLIAVANSRSNDEIYFHVLPGAEHFKESWHFTDKGFTLKSDEADDVDIIVE